jgi:hypothetical protein
MNAASVAGNAATTGEYNGTFCNKMCKPKQTPRHLAKLPSQYHFMWPLKIGGGGRRITFKDPGHPGTPPDFLPISFLHFQVARPVPWKAILTSIPVWGAVLGMTLPALQYFTLLTSIPQYMKEILNFNIDEVNIYLNL